MGNKQVLIWLKILPFHILQIHHYLNNHLGKVSMFTHKNTNFQHKRCIKSAILRMLNMKNHNQYTRYYQDMMIQDIPKYKLTCIIFHFHNTKYMKMSFLYMFYMMQNIVNKPCLCLCSQVDMMSRIQNQGDILYLLIEDMRSIELLRNQYMMSREKYRSHIQILMCLRKSQLDRSNSKLDSHQNRTKMMLRCYKFCINFSLSFHKLDKKCYTWHMWSPHELRIHRYRLLSIESLEDICKCQLFH